MFREVLFPTDSTSKNDDQDLTLRRLKRFVPKPSQSIIESTIIVFDLETTGLDSKSDRIIEIGAIKLVNLEPVAEFSTLVSTDIEISPTITNITGLTNKT